MWKVPCEGTLIYQILRGVESCEELGVPSHCIDEESEARVVKQLIQIHLLLMKPAPEIKSPNSLFSAL